MKSKQIEASRPGSRWLRWAYAVIVGLLAFTGMGQMPIYRRYYVSDIPGLGWAGDFYATHLVHYLAATALAVLAAYAVTDYLLAGRRRYRLTGTAYLRLALLAGLILTGVLRVLKNLPSWSFPPGANVLLDLSHMGLTMALLGVLAAAVVMRRGWLAERRPG